MKLSHEYNEFVVGLVVTDTETNRSVNFQFEKDTQTNHPEPNYFLTHSCEGDHTASAFTEEELDVISNYVSELPETKELKEAVTAVMYSHLAEEMKELQAEQGYLHDFQIKEFAEKIEWIYVLVDNGEMVEHFNTKEEAQAEIDGMDDENAYLCKIVHMPENEYLAVFTITEMVSDSNNRQEILNAFNAEMFSDSKAFVSEQLAELGLNNDLEKCYFGYLIANVYSVGGFYLPKDEDGESFTGDTNPKTFEQYSTEYINNLIYQVFDKKVDISKLI